MEEHGGALGAAVRNNGILEWRAAATLKFSQVEHPIRWQDRLLGFFEHFGPGLPGKLLLVGSYIRFEPTTAANGGGGTGGGTSDWSWDLRDFRSLQSASDSIQFTTHRGDLVQVAFKDDSPRRWEILLKHALQEVWHREGKGEILEVQTRIRTGR
jgi:hypothetical protein